MRGEHARVGDEGAFNRRPVVEVIQAEQRPDQGGSQDQEKKCIERDGSLAGQVASLADLPDSTGPFKSGP